MTLTGEQLLAGFSKFIGDFWESTSTSAGSTTTLVDTITGRYGNNLLVDRYVRRVATEEVRRLVVPFTQSTGEMTVNPAFATTVASGITYQIHKYDPIEKWRALDAARLSVLPWVFREIRDDTLTGDGRSEEFPIPSTVLWGPEACYIETPLPYDADWNLIASATNSQGKAAGNWATANVTVSTYGRQEYDKLVPKHEDTCLKLVTTGTWTYDLTVGYLDTTATLAAGRKIEFAMWVYSLSTAPALRIIVDGATVLASGTAHQGRGWELLRVEGSVAAGNATTLTLRLYGTGTLSLFRENAFLAFGQVPNPFDEDHPVTVERDSTIQLMRLSGVPRQGRQIRLVGKAPLTALGTTGQAAATMEVDERSATLLYAAAAEELLGLEILSQPNQRDVLARIAAVKDKRKAYQKEWKHKMPTGRVVSPYEA